MENMRPFYLVDVPGSPQRYFPEVKSSEAGPKRPRIEPIQPSAWRRRRLPTVIAGWEPIIAGSVPVWERPKPSLQLLTKSRALSITCSSTSGNSLIWVHTIAKLNHGSDKATD